MDGRFVALLEVHRRFGWWQDSPMIRSIFRTVTSGFKLIQTIVKNQELGDMFTQFGFHQFFGQNSQNILNVFAN